MDTMISGIMPPKKRKKTSGGKTYPSREKTKYPGIPVEYWDALENMAEEDGLFNGRSVSYLTKIAVKEFLAKHDRLPKKTNPPEAT